MYIYTYAWFMPIHILRKVYYESYDGLCALKCIV